MLWIHACPDRQHLFCLRDPARGRKTLLCQESGATLLFRRGFVTAKHLLRRYSRSQPPVTLSRSISKLPSCGAGCLPLPYLPTPGILFQSDRRLVLVFVRRTSAASEVEIIKGLRLSIQCVRLTKLPIDPLGVRSRT